MPETIAIIGNGNAAVECIKALRKNGYDGAVEVFASSNLPVYNPMLTSYYVSGEIEYPMMFPYGDSNKVFEDHNAVLHAGSAVTRLSAKNRTLTNSDGLCVNFDKCLISSGASPFVPHFPGSDCNGIYTMRTIEDAIRLKKVMDNKPRKALVVGASMVGIKLVEMFWKIGIEVCLADIAPYIFPLSAHPDCAVVIEERLREMGVRLRFSAGIERAEDQPDGSIRAWFGDGGEPENADLLMACIGVRANVGFIDQDEIETRQAVVVDDHMQTNVPGIYAAGDCCMGIDLLSGEHQVIGLLANARSQGRVAGINMAGGDRAYRGEILHNITHFLGMDFIGIGDVRNYARDEKMYNGRRFAQFFYDDKGALCGANFLDSLADCGVVKNALVKSVRQSLLCAPALVPDSS